MIKASRRSILSAIITAFIVPRSTRASSSAVSSEVTIAQERFAKIIALAHQRRVVAESGADGQFLNSQTHDNIKMHRYVEAHWHDYIDAAQAILNARV